MRTPVQIDFRAVEERMQLREEIERHIAELKSRYGRITAARVVVKGTGRPA